MLVIRPYMLFPRVILPSRHAFVFTLRLGIGLAWVW